MANPEKKDPTSRSEGGDAKTRELSQQVKRLAAEQPIRIQLTAEQFDALLESWKAADPTRPAQITFVVDQRRVGEFSVAAYSYSGDTCCA